MAEPDEVPVSLVAVLTGLPDTEFTLTFSELADAGSLAEPRPGWCFPTQRAPVDDTVRARFVRQAAEAAAAAATRVRVDEEVAGLTAPAWPGAFDTRRSALEWLTENHRVLAAALRVGAEPELGETAYGLARSLWGLTPQVGVLLDDLAWRRDLAVWGERAARNWGNQAALAALLDHSARVAVLADDPHTAEDQWVRAWRQFHRIADEPRVLAVMDSLIDLFVGWNRLHRALDVAFELLDEHRERQMPVDVARTLARIGTLMDLARRPEAASAYLRQADAAFAELTEPQPKEHAAAMLRLGRVKWASGENKAARTGFQRALALLIDVDDEAADRVRKLLHVPDGADLPA